MTRPRIVNEKENPLSKGDQQGRNDLWGKFLLSPILFQKSILAIWKEVQRAEKKKTKVPPIRSKTFHGRNLQDSLLRPGL